MAGFLNGKYAGFLSEEIFSEDVNIEAVDGDLLAEELEQAQEELFTEQEKFNTATEAECETTETVAEIEAALESGTNDVVYAKLLVNKLIKHNTVFYGTSKPLSSGLESDRGSDARSILQAGLEDGKGMVSAIKEFIAKVWQKIKDAFAWVWNKMKDFWAWLTGSNKKAKEKLEKTIVVAATVEVVEAKKEDIKKATEDINKTFEQKASDTGNKLDKLIDELEKFTSYLPTGSDTVNDVIESGKFKGKKIKDLTSDECFEWMDENKEKIIEAVTGNIIVEEIAKTTGIDESVVCANILSAKEILALIESDKSKAMAIVDIISKNIDDNRESINKALILPSIYTASATVDNIVISIKDAFEDYSKFKKETNFETELLKAVEGVLSKEVKQTIPYMLSNSSTIAGVSSYFRILGQSLEDVSKIINFYDTVLNEKWEDSSSKDVTLNLKSFVSSFPISITDVAGDKNSLFLHYVNPFEKSFLILTGVTQTIEKYNVDVGIFKEFSVLAKRTNLDNVINGSLDVKKIQSDIEKITSEMDKILDKLAKNEVQKYRDDKQWKQGKNSFIHFVSKFAAYNPKIIIDAARANTDRINSILNIMDIPGAIAQAAKELK